MTNIAVVLIHLVLLLLCYNYSILNNLLFTHPVESFGFLEKRLFEFLTHPIHLESKIRRELYVHFRRAKESIPKKF